MLVTRFLINFYKNLKFYFKNISIHGLYSIFRSTYWLETIFWVIIFLIAVHYLFQLLYENLINFYNQPVTKAIETTVYPVTLVPFPAVTVCNFNVAQKSNVLPIAKML